jgi:hypothetical protein
MHIPKIVVQPWSQKTAKRSCNDEFNISSGLTVNIRQLVFGHSKVKTLIDASLGIKSQDTIGCLIMAAIAHINQCDLYYERPFATSCISIRKNQKSADISGTSGSVDPNDELLVRFLCANSAKAPEKRNSDCSKKESMLLNSH